MTAFLTGWPSILAAILNYLKRREVRETYLESHFRWQIRTFSVGRAHGAGKLLRANPEMVLRSEFCPTGMRRFGDDPQEYLATLRTLGFSLRVVRARSRPHLQSLDHVEDLPAL